MDLKMDLTLEQQFQLTLLQNSVSNLSREDLQDLLLKATHLVMLKDNIIKDLMKSGVRL